MIAQTSTRKVASLRRQLEGLGRDIAT